jgi:hypothetical protein
MLQTGVIGASKTKPLIPKLDFSRLAQNQQKKNSTQVAKNYSSSQSHGAPGTIKSKSFIHTNSYHHTSNLVPAMPKQQQVQQPGAAFKLDLGVVKASQKDFHDEFMSKFEEYSESWRAAAVKEKRF